MTDEEMREKALKLITPFIDDEWHGKGYPVKAEILIDQLIPLIREETLKEVGEWMLDVYDRTPRGERIALLEKVIGYLVAGQKPKE